MNLRRAMRALIIAGAFTSPVACGNSSSTTPSPPPPALPTASFTITFDQNPVPFRSTGCSFSTPSGWYTGARVQETAGVALTVTTLTQKLDGAAGSVLAESFNSRFSACGGASFTPGMILANGTACATVGVCTAGTYSTYQFSLVGTDANGHAVTLDSPVLQLGAR